MSKRDHLTRGIVLAACAIAGGIAAASCYAQAPQSNPEKKQQAAVAETHLPSAPTVTGSHYGSTFAGRARKYYALTWGIQELTVRAVESGELIRFNYRVVDPAKAHTLNDKKNEAYLVDETAGVRLTVPTLEKVGQLRQTATPEEGKVYWMAFSNKGGFVKAGDHVNVDIGNFHAVGLVVE